MTLHVFDDEFVYRGRVENWISMTWEEEYRGEGRFTLVTYDTDEYAAILRHGWYFYRTDRPSAMLSVKVERDTEKKTITVCGYTALHLLSRRIIDLKYEGTNVEQTVYDLINGDLRGLTQVETAPLKGLTAEYECEFEGVVMLDAVLEALNESDYGIRAVFDYKRKTNVIEVYEGADQSYSSENGGTVFSQEFGNLRHLIVTEDDDLYKNVAYVTGAANNDSRTVYYQYISDEVRGQHELWREVIIPGENQLEDESNEAWRKRQKQIAIKALQDMKNAMSFEVELATGTFGKTFDLGCKVTCKSRRYGLRFDTRVMKYLSEYKKGVETERVTLGNKPVGYVRGAIIKYG